MHFRCSYSQLIFSLCLVHSTLMAGNESGGDWIANRYLGKAYETLSQICREVEQKKSTWTLDEVVALEKLITQTSVSSKAEKNEAAIQLEKTKWGTFFDMELEVQEEIMAPYLSLMKKNSLPLKRTEKKNPTITRDGVVSWLLLPELKSQKAGEAACNDVKWVIPQKEDIRPSLEKLKLSFKEAGGLTPRHFQVWLREDKAVFDLLSDKEIKQEPEVLSGVLCIKRK